MYVYIYCNVGVVIMGELLDPPLRKILGTQY